MGVASDTGRQIEAQIEASRTNAESDPDGLHVLTGANREEQYARLKVGSARLKQGRYVEGLRGMCRSYLKVYHPWCGFGLDGL